MFNAFMTRPADRKCKDCVHFNAYRTPDLEGEGECKRNEMTDGAIISEDDYCDYWKAKEDK